MSTTPQSIEEHLKPILKSVLKKVWEDWVKSNRTSLIPFMQSTRNLLNTIEGIPVDDTLPFKFRSYLETVFKEYLEWTNTLDYANNDIFSNKFFETWKTEFTKSLEEFPKERKVTIKDAFWEPQKDDVLKIRLWKWKKRRQIGLINLNLKVKNKFRKIFKKPSLSPARLTRKFSLHNFLNCYLATPISEFLVQEWQRFLQQTANQLFQCHTQSEAIKNNSLFHGESIKSCLTPETAELTAQIDKIKQQISDLIQHLEDSNHIKDQTGNRLEDVWVEIFNNIQQKWELAGSFALSNRRFNLKKIDTNWHRIQNQFEKIKSAWTNHFIGEKEEWQKDIELSLMQLQTSRICNETTGEVAKKINQDVIPIFSEAGETIAFHLKKFKKIEPDSKTEIRKVITTENRLLVEKLKQQKLPAVIDVLLEAQINAILKNYFDQVKTGLEIFSEQHLIFRHRDLENLIPKSSTVDVPFRLLIVEEFFPSLSIAHGNLAEEISKQLEELLRDVSEIDQIVEYNLDTALNMLQERKDTDIVSDAHSVAIEGLERSINKIQELIDKNKKIGDQTRESLFQISFDYISHIQELADNEKVNQLQLRFAKAKAKERLRNYRVLLWNKLKSVFSRAKKWSINVLQKSITLYSRLKKITGLAPTEQEVEVKLTKFLTDTQKRIASLPFVYHRLFRKEPISDERFFAGRTGELAGIENAITEWQSGQYAVTAIVGEKGSGKTTLLNLAEQKFLLNTPIIKINLAETTISTEEKLYELLANSFDTKQSKTIDELENRLRNENDRKICIFENIQNLFIRTVDGFDALERFLLFISRTDRTIFWIISCTLYSWNYLDKVIQISKLCKNTVNLGALDLQEVENIILKRHRISGYQLYFDIPESVTHSRQFKKLKNEDQQQKFLKDMYFDQLNELSAGNITVAMSFWLSAIREISENMMVLWPSIDLDYSFLHQLSSDELFTLAALLQHETLEAEEHAMIFHQNIQQSLLLLNRLKTKRIIVDVGDRYQIHHLLYRPVVAVLKSKNIIH